MREIHAMQFCVVSLSVLTTLEQMKKKKLLIED